MHCLSFASVKRFSFASASDVETLLLSIHLRRESRQVPRPQNAIAVDG